MVSTTSLSTAVRQDVPAPASTSTFFQTNVKAMDKDPASQHKSVLILALRHYSTSLAEIIFLLELQLANWVADWS